MRRIQREVLPVANARHELNRQQVRQAKDGLGLPLGIGMEGIGTNLRPVGQQAIENVDRFPDATGNEAAEQRDVGVGDVVIADPAPAAIAEMVFTEQILFVDVPLGAVGSGALARSPRVWGT